MRNRRRRVVHVSLAVLTVAAAAMLALSALRTYSALEEQREVYLRSRAAAMAGQLETLAESTEPGQWAGRLSAEEEALEGLAILDRASSPAELAAIWEGRELFRTEMADNGRLFRAYIPFHANGQMRVARIDLAAKSADYLTEHAGHHLVLVGIGGVLIVFLTMLSLYGAERLARGEEREAELRHLAAIGAMSASLAHEIRNPLGTIKGFAQLLEEQLKGEHQAYLAPILAESSRLEALVRDLLLYGRPAEPRYVSVQAAEIAATAKQHAQYLADVRFDSACADVTFETDPQLLEQALLNLIRNGADAAREGGGGEVRLEILRDGDTGILRVTDNGPGLAGEAKERLFEPFFTTKATGTGLGLSISKKLIEQLGGQLTLEPGAGGGTVAEIRLPLKHDE